MRSTLIQYQDIIEKSINDFNQVINDISSLPNADRLGVNLNNYKSKISDFRSLFEDIKRNEKPKMMVYGQYNTGKSTLLNAILGKEVASMADRVETKEVASFDFNGYTIFDTPGLDILNEDDEKTLGLLSKCQVVMVVISNKGAFESDELYEGIKKVFDAKKKLVVVINLKEINEESQLGEYKRKILDNLQKKNIHVDDFPVTEINAKLALMTAIDEDCRELDEYKKLERLRSIIMEKLKQTNSFDKVLQISHDLIEVYNDVYSYVSSKSSVGNEIGGVYALLKKRLQDQKEEISNLVRSKSSVITSKLNALVSTGNNVSDNLESQINDIYMKAQEVAIEEYKQLVGELVDEFRDQIKDNPAITANNMVSANEHSSKAVDLILTSKPEFVTPSVGEVSQQGIKLTPTTLASITAAINFIPLPPPLKAIAMAVTALLGIFSDPNAKERERVEAQARAEREAAAAYEKSLLEWKEEIRLEFKIGADDFCRKLDIALKQNIDETFRPIFEMIQEIDNENVHSSESMNKSLSALLDNKDKVHQLIKELS